MMVGMPRTDFRYYEPEIICLTCLKSECECTQWARFKAEAGWWLTLGPFRCWLDDVRYPLSVRIHRLADWIAGEYGGNHD